MVAIEFTISVADARGEDVNLPISDDKESTILPKSGRLSNIDCDCPSAADTAAWAASPGAAADVVDDAAVEILAAALPRKVPS